MRKLTLVGSESFIGKVLAARCRAQGIEVAGIDSVAATGTVRADIRDPKLAEHVPQGAPLVHLAAISRDPDCRANPALAFDVNVTGTLNVLRAAQQREVPHVIFASSEWVYGEVRNDEVQVEDQAIDLTRMKSEYAITKLVAEQGLRLARANVAVTVLRFGIVYGPRKANWSAVESLFNSVRTQPEAKVGCLRTARRFIHVEDIASGVLAAAAAADGFRIFNLSGDRLVTLGEVIETSARILGRKPRIVEGDAAAASVRNPDNSRARAALRWQPAIGLEEGLRGLDAFLKESA